jgi:hypothetical protein
LAKVKNYLGFQSWEGRRGRISERETFRNLWLISIMDHAMHLVITVVLAELVLKIR